MNISVKGNFVIPCSFQYGKPCHFILTNGHQRCSIKEGVKNFAKFTENICARVSFLIKLQACTFFTEHLQTIASISSKTPTFHLVTPSINEKFRIGKTRQSFEPLIFCILVRRSRSKVFCKNRSY